VIQCLNRQRRRPILPEHSHSGVGDSRTHLYQAVEASPISPPTAPAVGIQGNINKAGARLATRPSVQPEIVERVRSVSVDQDVRPPQQVKKTARSLEPRRSSRAQRLPRVTSGTTPGSSHVGGSMRSTSAPKPARNRVATGPARTRVRSRTRIPWSGRSGVEDIVEFPKSSVARIASSGSRLTLSPCACVAHAAFDRIAAAQPLLWMIAVSSASAFQLPTTRNLGFVGRDAEHGQSCGAVVRRVGVQSYPPVSRLVVAREGIPGRRERPTVRPNGPTKPQGRKPPAHRHLCHRPKSRGNEFRNGTRSPNHWKSSSVTGVCVPQSLKSTDSVNLWTWTNHDSWLPRTYCDASIIDALT
jgi:hypothetical protein